MYRSIIILGTAIYLLTCCVGQIQAASERGYVSGNFYLMLDNAMSGFVKSVDGGAINAEVINEAAGASYFVKKHIGQPKYEDISVQIGFGLDKSIYDWIGQSWKGNYQRKGGKVIACDYQLTPKSEKQFSEALITETTIPACDSSSKEPAYITVTFAPEYIKPATPDGTSVKGENGRNEQKMWLPANFRLTIDGLDCSRVTKIDSFTVKQSVARDDVGDARDHMTEPGKLEFPNLKITLAEVSSKTWADWHDDFLVRGNNGEGQEKNGTLVFVGPNQQTELARIKLFNLGIFRLASDKSEANADQVKRVMAELYCERMEFETTQIGSQSSEAPPAANQVLPPNGKGEFGKTYSMRQGQPLYFTLQSANYTVEPVIIGKQCFTANADEKLLVLHFTVQNPGKAAQLVRFDSLRISATDDTQMNRLQKQAWGMEKTNELVGFNLAPNQTVSLFCAITVPAKGEPSTILVKSNRDNDGPDLPYDVVGHVPALPAPFADKSDPTGATAREEVAAKRGVAYPCDYFAVNVESMAYTTESLALTKLNRGERYLVCTLLVKNHTPLDHLLRHDMIQPILTSDEGERMLYKGMLLENTNRPVSQTILPGDEMRVRIYFLVPREASPKRLMIQERKSRRYLYAVSS